MNRIGPFISETTTRIFNKPTTLAEKTCSFIRNNPWLLLGAATLGAIIYYFRSPHSPTVTQQTPPHTPPRTPPCTRNHPPECPGTPFTKDNTQHMAEESNRMAQEELENQDGDIEAAMRRITERLTSPAQPMTISQEAIRGATNAVENHAEDPYLAFGALSVLDNMKTQRNTNQHVPNPAYDVSGDQRPTTSGSSTDSESIQLDSEEEAADSWPIDYP
ncbi:MAG: hypothetical protein KDK44_06330 [Chlamydiia bacterium]|nr:hypothetical protein [Chlamydiia bacterium]